ncbi:hypothetical protein NC651_004343 [Populus alba x Populus x berolinensis]|nr:hypothetical protein NC651_004343 [Populus alba x Populus x berolinensis]
MHYILIPNSSSNSEILITKDLPGGFSKVSNKDLNLELQFTKTWDVPLNLKSAGKVYSQRCNSFPPLRFLEESCLELKLVPSSHCESVCTLDEVRSALQRAERETMTKKRSPPPTPPASDIKEDEISTTFSSTGIFAAACPDKSQVPLLQLHCSISISYKETQNGPQYFTLIL